MGKAWALEKSLKIKNHQGRLEGGGNASPLGISLSVLTPPGRPRATPRQAAITGKGVNSKAGGLDPGPLALCLTLDKSPSSG